MTDAEKEKERLLQERAAARLVVVNHAATVARLKNEEVFVRLCRSAPYCLKTGDEAAAGCRFCERIVAFPDGTTKVLD